MLMGDSSLKPLDAPNSSRPSLAELGSDLLHVSRMRRLLTLFGPLFWLACFLLFALLRWWPLAVLSVMTLSFVTYGSTSHDLVHRTLKLPRGVNDFLLSLIELLSLRSGTAYRLSHLHHHSHLLDSSDIEGACAHGRFWEAMLTGPTMQVRLWLWAWKQHPRMRRRLAIEGVEVVSLIILSVVAVPWSSVPLLYVLLVIAGSWLFPLATVFLPHDGEAEETLKKTRLFRGRLVQMIAFNHLYHLEHHLYPAVPHHHWKTLGDRLDPYFEREGIQPYELVLRVSPLQATEGSGRKAEK